KNKVYYIIGIGKNSRLLEASQALIDQAAEQYRQTEKKQRLFGDFEYAAKSWSRHRRVIVKAEHTFKGSNPRYVVTNLSGDPQYLYDKVYCARGEMENRIKEQQLYLFSDRTSSMNWLPNQFRVLLSGIAYTLLQTIRRLGLAGTDLAKARCDTIRLKLLKIGAVIIENTRRIRFLLSSAYPWQNLFRQVVANLEGG
ncbi:MAG: transposase, partial [Marinilabiliaceae bacterium]